MRVQTIRFDDRRRPRPRDKIVLGFEGDNLVERLEFILPVIAEAQTAQLMMGGKYANAVLLQRDDEAYYADLTAEIVGTDGEVEAYVQINGSGGEAWHSDVMLLITGALPDVETEVEQRFPTAVETMLTEIAGHRAEMSETLSEAQAAADRAEDAAVNPPIIGDNGHWLLWDFETGRYIDSGVAAQGPPGQAYTLPPATPDTLGGMMPGAGLVVDEDGRANVVEDGCELIDELTLQEAVSEFSLDVTPDGKPYNFRRMIIVVNKPAVKTSGYMWLTINNMDKSEQMNRLAVVSTHDENERNAWCDMSIVAGRVRSIFVDTSFKAVPIVSVGTTQSAFMNVKATSINAIRYNYGNFPAGTKIMIYGEWRRDNE